MVMALIAVLVGLERHVEALPKGGYAHPEAIIQPEKLKTLIEKKSTDIRIIDVRDRMTYLTGHIPGAVQLWRPEIEDKNHPLPGTMAPRTQIGELMGHLGVKENETLVIYSDGPDNGRLWWILAYYGFPLQQMKLLDGGIDAWKSKGYPFEMFPRKIEKTTFKLPERPKIREPLLCTLPEVRSALKDPGKVVLDVRSKKEYLGEEVKKGAFKPGHIPGVIWTEWTEALVTEGPFKGYWKSAEEIKKIFSAKGVSTDKDVYIY
jgi:thiosulfate/3-mercaptopyruvate sulfurtransferase